MGKKKGKHIVQPKKEEKKEPVKSINRFSLGSFKIQALILAIIGLICFANSFYNDYALDDGIVIQKNEYVQQGAQGIHDILSNDAYKSFYEQMGSEQELAGGRYRPLSIVTFAIEQQLFGPNEGEAPQYNLATIRHVVNVLLYIFSVIVLLYFLRTFIFKENHLLAFIASLLFLIHPIHTEVVANIKSRDEIMSFLFIILTFIAVFRYDETKKTKQLIYGLVFYFLALLSKEYAVTLLIFIPMLLYIIKGDTIKNSLVKTIPFLALAVVYLFIRCSVVGMGSTTATAEVLNNPFLYATSPERWATKIEILNRYLRLLFYPYPLSSDYSYNTIPYTNFTNGWVWVSVFIHLSMIAAMVVLFIRRNILSFAIAFYLFNLFLVSNLVFDIGATMGERLVYHSSLGFVLIIAIAAAALLKKINYTRQPAMAIGTAVACLVVIWCATNDIRRNAQWNNNVTLFLADVKTVSNSVLANGNAGKDYVDMSFLPENKDRSTILMDSGLAYLNRAVTIDKKFVNGHIDLAFAYSRLQQYDLAAKNIIIARSLYQQGNPYIDSISRDIAAGYTSEAAALLSTRPKDAIELMVKATEVAPNNVDAWNNLGSVYYFNLKDYDKARQALKKVLQLDPNNAKALKGMAALSKQGIPPPTAESNKPQ
jgi:tetratricopeptide (TPR) repeat protein